MFASLLFSASNVVKLGQVTPGGGCLPHKSGPALAVSLINALNNGQGFPIGTNNKYITFNLTQYDAGSTGGTEADYDTLHFNLINQLIYQDGVDLIVGSCSGKATNESYTANDAGKIIMAQVGPNALYEDDNGDPSYPYLFGIHVSSYQYAQPAIRLMNFQGARTLAVFGRKQSLFFQTTCSYGASYAVSLGMEVVMQVEYQATGADSLRDNLTVGSSDYLYHQELARNISTLNPDMIVGCMGGSEADIYLGVWNELGWSPKGSFFTCTTWGWPEAMGLDGGDGGYLAGSGQWHKAMTYTDDLVGTVANFETQYTAMFSDHTWTYDSVGSYVIPFVYMKAMQKAWRYDTVNDTEAADLLGDATRYEKFRVALSLLLEAQTLFGPVEFDTRRRNVGRGPANMQYLPTSIGSTTMSSHCVAPTEVAEAVLVYPTPGSQGCSGDQLADANSSACWLCSKCVDCPNVTISSCDSGSLKRTVAYPGESSSTCNVERGLPKEVDCDWVETDSDAAQGIGFLALVLALLKLALLAIVFMKRHTPVMRASQPLFCYLMIIGALFADLSVFIDALAGGEPSDFNCAWRPAFLLLAACLLFAPLFLKTYRVWRIFDNPSMKNLNLSNKRMLGYIASVLGVNYIILAIWYIVETPEPTPERYEALPGIFFEDEVRYCYEGNNPPVFVVLIYLLQGSMLAYGVFLGFKVRNAPSEYNESRTILAVLLVIMVVSVIAVPLFNIQTDALAAFILVSIAVLMVSSVSTGVIFAPKLLMIFTGHGFAAQVGPNNTMMSVAPTGTIASKTESDNGEKVSELADRVRELEEENLELKEKLKGLEASNGK